MIEIKDLEYKYKNSKKAINNINLNIVEGEFVAVIGQNGSGKSTLARLIAGIDYPTKGNVVVDNIDTKNKKQTLDLRKTIGIVFQNPENQIIFEKIYDDIEFGLKNLGIENREERIKNAIESVGIKNITDTYEISLGQKQRVAIASILAMKPKYIVFDEPTTMLDPKGKKDILNIIKELNKKGITIIYVTNVIDEILIADRIIALEDGIIKKEFKKKDVLDNIEFLKELNLEIPVVLDIILKLKEKQIDAEFLLEDILE